MPRQVEETERGIALQFGLVVEAPNQLTENGRPPVVFFAAVAGCTKSERMPSTVFASLQPWQKNLVNMNYP
jgi:hypothetical protein